MRLHRFSLRSAALSLLVLCTGANADPQWCTGKVMRLLQDRDGTVHAYMNFRNDWIQLCNTETAWNGVSPSICKGWVSSAKVAVAAGLNVTIQYGEAPACHLLPLYGAAPGPGYVMLLTPGL